MSAAAETAGASAILTAALAYAARGIPVFPCNPAARREDGGKARLTPHGFKDASTDPAMIRGWWAQYPNALIGVPTGAASGFFVADLDVRPDAGIDGEAGLAALVKAHGTLPVTPHQETPSGGMHILFKAPDGRTIKSCAGTIGPGIDVRGDGGYICIAPSVRADGAAYRWEKSLFDTPLADAPQWLLDLIPEGASAPAEGATGDVAPGFGGDMDTLAIASVDTAPVAFQRVAGALRAIDNSKISYDAWIAVTHAVAAAVNRDEAFYSLVYEPWALAYPDNTPEVVRAKWNSIGNTRVGWRWLADQARGAGWIDPDPCPEFSDDAPIEETAEPAKAPTKKGHLPPLTPLQGVNAKQKPPRRWTVPEVYMPAVVTVTVAAGGTGKTTLALLYAIAIATGRSDIIGDDVVRRSGPVLIVSNEEDRDEMERRVQAYCRQYAITDRELDGRLFLVASDTKATFAFRSDGLATPTAAVGEIVEQARAIGAAHILADPFASLHEGLEENDNAALESVMTFLRDIARQADVSFELIHHSNKGGSKKPGDMDAARGASAIVDAARIVRTLTRADEEDIDRAGLTKEEGARLVCLTTAKNNYGPTRTKRWFRLEVVNLENGPDGDELFGGDQVAIMVPFEMPVRPVGTASTTKESVEVIRTILGKFPSDRDTVAWAMIRGKVQIALKLSEATVRRRLDHALPLGETIEATIEETRWQIVRRKRQPDQANSPTEISRVRITESKAQTDPSDPSFTSVTVRHDG